LNDKPRHFDRHIALLQNEETSPPVVAALENESVRRIFAARRLSD